MNNSNSILNTVIITVLVTTNVISIGTTLWVIKENQDELALIRELIANSQVPQEKGPTEPPATSLENLGSKTQTTSTSQNISKTTPTTAVKTSTKTVTPSTMSGISASSVAAHKLSTDCWMSISGKVYNFTSFLNAHPGGRPVMIPYCGVDATTAFQTKGGRGSSHSQYAFSLLPTYYVGDLAGAQTQNPGSGTLTPPAGSNRFDDDD